MIQEPTYSIIIPHYNIPDLLMRCLDSIPVREDVQVIVVDDNSPDAETYLDRYPALSRPYLDFIRTTKGGGAGYARNIGMGLAKGQWLLFADADDFFVDDFDAIINSFQANKTADIVFYRSTGIYSELPLKPSHQTEYLNYLNTIITQCIDNGDETNIRCQHYVPWGKFYKHQFISSNAIIFDETRFANDVCFSVAAGCRAASIQINDTPLYVHTLRSGSLSDNFALKTGELETRAGVMFRAQKIIYESGRLLTGRNPLTDFLSSLYHRNRHYYDQLFRRLPKIGLSQWTILRQVAAWEKYSTKILIYLHSIFLIIQTHLSPFAKHHR